MEKKFFEAFPNLKLEGVHKDFFEQVAVEKITATKRKDLLRIYIRSERLIEKEVIYAVENEIKRQFFSREYLIVKIYEKFILSEQYTPEKLMGVYKESMLMELKECEHMLYTMFRQADIRFPEDNVMELILEDSVIAKSKEEELVGILDKVLNERCGFRVKFETSYKEAKTGKYKEDDELRIKKIVAGISSRLEGKAGGEYGQGNSASPSSEAMAGEVKPSGEMKPQALEKNGTPVSAGTEKKSYNRPDRASDRGFRDRGMQKRALKRSDNPNVIFGRDFEDESINIEEIWGEMGEVTIRGKVRALETREIRNERTIVSFEITDFTDTIKVKMFVHNEQLSELTADLKVGAFLRLKGVTVNDTFDRELTIGSVIGVMKIPDFTTARMDNSARKRVELHCHTKMSDMDGVSDVKDIIKCAKKWGHKAIAITDHGCVQAFPDANHALDHGDDFKVIYGVEGYLVDDLKEIVTDGRGQTLSLIHI